MLRSLLVALGATVVFGFCQTPGQKCSLPGGVAEGMCHSVSTGLSVCLPGCTDIGKDCKLGRHEGVCTTFATGGSFCMPQKRPAACTVNDPCQMNGMDGTCVEVMNHAKCVMTCESGAEVGDMCTIAGTVNGFCNKIGSVMVCAPEECTVGDTCTRGSLTGTCVETRGRNLCAPTCATVGDECTLSFHGKDIKGMCKDVDGANVCDIRPRLRPPPEVMCPAGSADDSECKFGRHEGKCKTVGGKSLCIPTAVSPSCAEDRVDGDECTPPTGAAQGEHVCRPLSPLTPNALICAKKSPCDTDGAACQVNNVDGTCKKMPFGFRCKVNRGSRMNSECKGKKDGDDCGTGGKCRDLLGGRFCKKQPTGKQCEGRESAGSECDFDGDDTTKDMCIDVGAGVCAPAEFLARAEKWAGSAGELCAAGLEGLENINKACGVKLEDHVGDDIEIGDALKGLIRVGLAQEGCACAVKRWAQATHDRCPKGRKDLLSALVKFVRPLAASACSRRGPDVAEVAAKLDKYCPRPYSYVEGVDVCVAPEPKHGKCPGGMVMDEDTCLPPMKHKRSGRCPGAFRADPSSDRCMPPAIRDFQMDLKKRLGKCPNQGTPCDDSTCTVATEKCCDNACVAPEIALPKKAIDEVVDRVCRLKKRVGLVRSSEQLDTEVLDDECEAQERPKRARKLAKAADKAKKEAAKHPCVTEIATMCDGRDAAECLLAATSGLSTDCAAWVESRLSKETCRWVLKKCSKASGYLGKMQCHSTLTAEAVAEGIDMSACTTKFEAMAADMPCAADLIALGFAEDITTGVANLRAAVNDGTLEVSAECKAKLELKGPCAVERFSLCSHRTSSDGIFLCLHRIFMSTDASDAEDKAMLTPECTTELAKINHQKARPQQNALPTCGTMAVCTSQQLVDPKTNVQSVSCTTPGADCDTGTSLPGRCSDAKVCEPQLPVVSPSSNPCANKAEGDMCDVAGVKGKCGPAIAGVMPCMPENPCANKPDGDRCSITVGTTEIRGTCSVPTGSTVKTCVPENECLRKQDGDKCMNDMGKCETVAGNKICKVKDNECKGMNEGDSCTIGKCKSHGGMMVCMPDMSIPPASLCGGKNDGDSCSLSPNHPATCTNGECRTASCPVGTTDCKVQVGSESLSGSCESSRMGITFCKVNPCGGKQDNDVCQGVPGMDSTAGKCYNGKCSPCVGKSDGDACPALAGELTERLMSGAPGLVIPSGMCKDMKCKLDPTKIQDLVCGKAEGIHKKVKKECGFELDDKPDWFTATGTLQAAKSEEVKSMVAGKCACAIDRLRNVWKNSCDGGSMAKEAREVMAIGKQSPCSWGKDEAKELLMKLKKVCPAPLQLDEEGGDCELPKVGTDGMCPAFLKTKDDECELPDVANCMPPLRVKGGKCMAVPLKLNDRPGKCPASATGVACTEDSACATGEKCCNMKCATPTSWLKEKGIPEAVATLDNVGSRKCDLLRLAGPIASGELEGVEVQALLEENTDCPQLKKAGKSMSRNGKSKGRPHPCGKAFKDLCGTTTTPEEQLTCMIEKRSELKGLCKAWMMRNVANAAGQSVRKCVAEGAQCADLSLITEKIECIEGLATVTAECKAAVKSIADGMPCFDEYKAMCKRGNAKEKRACLRRAIANADPVSTPCLEAMKFKEPCSVARSDYCFDEENLGSIQRCLLDKYMETPNVFDMPCKEYLKGLNDAESAGHKHTTLQTDSCPAGFTPCSPHDLNTDGIVESSNTPNTPPPVATSARKSAAFSTLLVLLGLVAATLMA